MELIADDLAQVGLRVKYDLLERSLSVTKLTANEYMMHVGYFNIDEGDFLVAHWIAPGGRSAHASVRAGMDRLGARQQQGRGAARGRDEHPRGAVPEGPGPHPGRGCRGDAERIPVALRKPGADTGQRVQARPDHRQQQTGQRALGCLLHARHRQSPTITSPTSTTSRISSAAQGRRAPLRRGVPVPGDVAALRGSRQPAHGTRPLDPVLGPATASMRTEEG